MVAFPVRTGGGDASSPQMCRTWADPYVVCGTYRGVNGNGYAFRWDLRTGSNVSVDLSTVGGNECEFPFYIDTDDHFQIGCFMSDDGVFHVCGNHHDNNTDGVRPAPKTGMHYMVCTDVTSNAAFTNSSNWVVPGGTSGAGDAEPGASLDNSTDGATYTYIYFDRLSDGTTLMMQSQSYQRGSSIGRCILGWTKKSGVNSGLWTPIGGGAVGTKPTSPALMYYTDHGATFNVEAQRAYCAGLLVVPWNGFDWVFSAALWRTRDSDGDSQQGMSVIYAKSNALGTWYDYAGNTYTWGASSYPSTTRSMPLTWYNHDATLVTGQPPITGQGVYSLTVDPGTTTDTFPGNLRCVLFNGDSVGGNTVAGTTLPTDTWLSYNWNGSTWVRSTVINLPGGVRLFRIGGVLFARANEGGPRRVTLRNLTSSKVHNFGMAISPVVASGIVYNPGPCPIWLREDRFVICVPQDSSPKVYTFPSRGMA